ncbi:hypothetical protein ACFX1Z_018346 [Malus domestica]
MSLNLGAPPWQKTPAFPNFSTHLHLYCLFLRTCLTVLYWVHPPGEQLVSFQVHHELDGSHSAENQRQDLDRGGGEINVAAGAGMPQLRSRRISGSA